MARSQTTPSRRRAPLPAAAAIAVAIAVAGGACGSMDPGGNADGGCLAAEGALLPWKTGNTWTYQVNNEGVVGMKQTTVGDMEPVGGTGPLKETLANKVTTHKSGMDETISWQVPRGDLVVRFREQAFSASTGEIELEEHWDPYKLHIDGTAAHKVNGATWLEIYQETKLPIGATPSTHEAHDRWTVLSACAPVTVPAGSFVAIYLQKVSATGGSAKTYWYVPGVGKVKESGGQLEELVAYSLVP
jgi:hypothetical protein